MKKSKHFYGRKNNLRSGFSAPFFYDYSEIEIQCSSQFNFLLSLPIRRDPVKINLQSRCRFLYFCKVKGISVVSRCIAFILLVIFTQQIGVGLYLHNHLHVKKSSQPLSSNSPGQGINYKCSCIDDFSMPFNETLVELISPITKNTSAHFSYRYKIIPFSSRLFNSLRAPPCNV